MQQWNPTNAQLHNLRVGLIFAALRAVGFQFVRHGHLGEIDASAYDWIAGCAAEVVLTRSRVGQWEIWGFELTRRGRPGLGLAAWSDWRTGTRRARSSRQFNSAYGAYFG